MSTTIIYSETATPTEAAVSGEDLWLSPGDLKRAAGWELKPEGMCRDDICIPIPAERSEGILRPQGAETWVNLAGFARYMDQPVAHDAVHDAWYFGQAPDEFRTQLLSLEAPDFTLPAYDGKTYTLSAFRDKKVLLLLWATW